MKAKTIKYALILIAMLLLFPSMLTAQEDSSEKRLALIGFENMDEDNQHDYLSALISAVLREDLSHTDGIILLERSLMNKVPEEQKMSDLWNYSTTGMPSKPADFSAVIFSAEAAIL